LKCSDVKNKIYALIDNQLSSSEAQALLLHINNCAVCKKEYDELIDIISELKDSAQSFPAININLEELLEKRNLYPEENKMKKKKLFFNKNIIKKVISYAAVFFLGIALYAAFTTGLIPMSSTRSVLDSSNSTVSNYSGSNLQKDGSSIATEEEQNDSDDEIRDNQNDMMISELELSSDKIIYNSNIVIEVDDYDLARENILNLIETNNAFIQNEDKNISSNGNLDYYTSHFIIRVPVDNFKVLNEKIEKIGQVQYSSSYATNVTYEYNDIEGIIAQLEIQKNRLLELYKQADKIAEIIEIENELARINTEISQNESILKNYDRKIEYSTVELSISEDVSQNSLVNPFNDIGKKIKSAFINSINAFMSTVVMLCIFIIKILPFIITLLIIFLIIRIILKKRNNKKQIEKNGNNDSNVK
jgi:hypothetical protein